MITKKKIVLILFMILLGVGFSGATDWSITLESTNNLSWDLSFVAGDEGNLINFYFMDFQYDNEEVVYETYTPNYTLYDSLPPLGVVANENEGYITNVSGAALGIGNGYTATANEVVHLGTFTFSQVSLNDDGNADVNFWLESNDFGVKIDEIVCGIGNTEMEYNVNAEGQAQIAPLSAVTFATVIDQSTNINTSTDLINFVLTPSYSSSILVTANSSNPEIIPIESIAFFVDENRTPLTIPVNMTKGEEAPLYLVATPTANKTGTTTITVIVTDAIDSSKTFSTSFDLTVELAKATLDGTLDGATTHRNTSPVTLSGEKSAGSQILLKIGDDDAVEIVPADVDGEWTYDWNPTTDGEYAYSLINRAGSVEAVFGEGTLVMDTVPPATTITERTVTYVHYGISDQTAHTIVIRAAAPDDADSDRFQLCLDGEKTGPFTNYGETSYAYAADGETHQAIPIPVDAAGNQQADGSVNPIEWILDADHSQVSSLSISLVEPHSEAAYVEIKWPTSSLAGGDLQVWAKSLADDDFEELPGQAIEDDFGNWWVFEDTIAPARIRSYLLTDASGSQTLVDFERLDDGEEPVDPVEPVDPTPPDTSDDGGGGGGCFISAIGLTTPEFLR